MDKADPIAAQVEALLPCPFLCGKDGVYEHDDHCPAHYRLAVEQALREALPTWRAIETVPKDGTPILAWMVDASPHRAWQPERERNAPGICYWTNHNGGGWVSHRFGTPVLWMPLPDGPPPSKPRRPMMSDKLSYIYLAGMGVCILVSPCKVMQPVRKTTLSFKVESIREFQIDGATVFDTTLCSYLHDERLTIRGKPWPVGTKVDFGESTV